LPSPERSKPIPVPDNRRQFLLNNFLCAPDSEVAKQALSRFKTDNLRATVGGMSPQERALAEGIDTAKDWAPVVAANLGVAGAAGAVSFASPEARQILTGGFVAGGIVGVGIEVGANILSGMEKHFPKAAEVAKRIAARHVGRWITMLSGSGILGTATGGFLDSFLAAHAAAAQAVPPGGGEWRGGHGEAVVGDESGRFIPRPEPPIQPAAEAGGPPTLSPEASELVNRAGEVAAQEAGEMADAAQGAADIAARQAAELQAATSVGLTGQELADGTIWGNELDFVNQQGVHHVEPATNLLKGFTELFAQSQPPTEIGPSDTAYMVNRDVAGWVVKQLDTLYMMEPSAMNPWQKALWEISRGLRAADWTDLQAVTEEYVRSTINH
jgi:hypothetical protein